MILVIPSIEFCNGICSNVITGVDGTDLLYSKYSNNPCELIQLWRRENAKSVHIQDTDSFSKESSEVNINGIIYLTEMTDIPITLSHNFKDLEVCRIFLDAGVYRLFIGKLFLEYSYEIQQLSKRFTPSRICAHIDTDGEYAYYDNNTIKVPLDYILKIIKSTGVNRIVYKNFNWSDSLNKSDLAEINSIYERFRFRITINGGVNSTADLLMINQSAQPSVDSIVIGSPLYQNKFPCQKIWRKVEAELEPQIV